MALKMLSPEEDARASKLMQDKLRLEAHLEKVKKELLSLIYKIEGS